MSHEIKKGELFLKEVMNRLSGDQDAALAAKITRKAISAFDSQIAGLNAKLVDAEEAVENAEEELKEAIYPKVMITDNRQYCNNIVKSAERLDNAKEEVKTIKESLDFFNDLLSKVD